MTDSSNIRRPIGFKPEEISVLHNMDVITQHAEDAAFLWILRDDAVTAPNYSLKELTDLDERVEANLDGLRVAGDVGWEVCKGELGNEEPGEVFMAGVIAFEGKEKERQQEVLELACSDPLLARALISALGWISFDNIAHIIENYTKSDNPTIRRIGIAVLAIHRKDSGSILSQALSDPDIRVKSRAIKAAGELGRYDLAPYTLYYLKEKNDECRFWASWAAARLGNRTGEVFEALKNIAESDNPYSERAAAIVSRCMSLRESKDWYQRLKSDPNYFRLAVITTGAIGIPDLADDIIRFMENNEVKKVAGEAFSMITGVDLEYEDLDGEEPEDLKKGPSEEPEDEEVELDPDEDLPWPEPELVMKWWSGNKTKFKSGVRYLAGKEISQHALMEVLLIGNQRQRAAAALELALLEQTHPLFEVRAPGKRQLERLK